MTRSLDRLPALGASVLDHALPNSIEWAQQAMVAYYHLRGDGYENQAGIPAGASQRQRLLPWALAPLRGLQHDLQSGGQEQWEVAPWGHATFPIVP